jgi:1,4-alpha-glucan branching enzyme
LNVTFSIRPPEEILNNIFLVGAFNNWKLSLDYQMKKAGGVYSITIPLKRGIYDYQYVVADVIDNEIVNPDWILLEGNTWLNSKEYDIFIYYNEQDRGGYERIIGYKRITQ